MKYKAKHPLKWFKVGRMIYKNHVPDLFNPYIRIESEAHAKGLHANQDKGHRYI